MRRPTMGEGVSGFVFACGGAAMVWAMDSTPDTGQGQPLWFQLGTVIVVGLSGAVGVLFRAMQRQMREHGDLLTQQLRQSAEQVEFERKARQTETLQFVTTLRDISLKDREARKQDIAQLLADLEQRDRRRRR